MIAHAIHVNEESFSLLNKPEWEAAFRRLRPFKFPLAHDIGGNLLAAEYGDVFASVISEFMNSKAVGMTTDGWSINKLHLWKFQENEFKTLCFIGQCFKRFKRVLNSLF